MLTERFDAALVWAHDLHREQKRKGTDRPYVSHLLAVTAVVLEAGGSEHEAIGALLHDAIEDADVSREDIARRHGDAVAAIVAGCSERLKGKAPWRERKEDFVASLATASPSVLRVACADKVDNARSVLRDLRRDGPIVWDRFNAGKDDQLWYYRALADVFTAKRAATGWLAEELEGAVAEIEELSKP